jgi:hypothetical protein
VSRDVRVFLDDMITACEKIQRYLAGRPREGFERDEQAFDAVLKNLEIIGEASKRLPSPFRDVHPEAQHFGRRRGASAALLLQIERHSSDIRTQYETSAVWLNPCRTIRAFTGATGKPYLHRGSI